MHEFSVISAVVDLVLAEMEKRNVITVKEVVLEVGELTFLAHDALEFGFRALVEKYPEIGDDALTIIPVPAEVECRECAYAGPMKVADSDEYHMGTPVFQCPRCGGPVSIIKGRETVVRNIRMEVEEPTPDDGSRP